MADSLVVTVRQAGILALLLILGTVASFVYVGLLSTLYYGACWPGGGPAGGTSYPVLCFLAGLARIPILPGTLLFSFQSVGVVGHVTNSAVWIIVGYCYLWLRRRDRSRRDRGSSGP